MTLPANHSPFNVRYSIQRHFQINFEQLHLDDRDAPLYTVNYADSFFDSDKRDRSSEVVDNLVTVQILHCTAGLKGFALVQFDCETRVGTKKEGDRGGVVVALMAVRVMEAFATKAFALYDFTADVDNPTLLSGCVVPMDLDGKRRKPTDHAIIPWEGGATRREVVTFRFVTNYDLFPGETYDDGV